MSTFLQGCGNENVMTMCLIYLLAGAFTTVSSAMGGVESVVHLGMSVISPRLLAAGVFVIGAFISTATGTSVGTVVAVTPIALGLAKAGNIDQYIIVGATIGGAMFGDNLSMISDTTIAATSTQGCAMKDKFKANFFIAFPAALLTIGLLIVFGKPQNIPEIQDYSYELVKVLPYLFVLVAALFGVNVFVVLTGGIALSGIVGIGTHSFGFLAFTKEIFKGCASMFEIFLLSMIVGGLALMVEKEGGIKWILTKIKKVIRNPKSAQLGIAAMVSLTDVATANNTVSILINGKVAREISEEYAIAPRKTAALLDVFSCIIQGVLPYSAQILLACQMIEGLESPFQVIVKCWYQYLLAIVALLTIGLENKRRIKN